MQRIIQVGNSDQLAMTIGHLILNAHTNAIELDSVSMALQKAQKELKELQEELSEISKGNPGESERSK